MVLVLTCTLCFGLDPPLAFVVGGSAAVCGSAAGRFAFAFALVVVVAAVVVGKGCSAGVIPGGAVWRGVGVVEIPTTKSLRKTFRSNLIVPT